MDDREFWAGIRQGLLTLVDLIERAKLKYTDERRTAQLRKELKDLRHKTK